MDEQLEAGVMRAFECSPEDHPGARPTGSNRWEGKGMRGPSRFQNSAVGIYGRTKDRERSERDHILICDQCGD
jgi:hypothetical protein